MLQAVTSREYKLILNSDRFQDRNKGCASFWQLIEFLVKEYRGAIDSVQNETKDEELRKTWYVDTPELALQQNKFILRVREEKEEKEDKKFKTTLKYRSSDRYISAFKNVNASGGKTKFEEDITPPFISKFSKSSFVETKRPPTIKTMGDVIRIFPGLAELKLLRNAPIATVKNFVAYEVFRKAGRIKFADQEPLVKVAFSFWYLPENIDAYPLITELSFDYDALDKAGENFPVAVVEASNQLFSSLQKQSGWLNRDNDTKTNYAYESL